MSGGRVAWLVATFATLSACSVEQQQSVPQPPAQLDETVFACSVEPILARQCSYNACHGQANSPLRVYTPGKLRAATPANINDASAVLTQAEHDGNFQSASGFAFDTVNVDDNFLLRKPLPATFGGFEHTGGAIFTDPNDPQYVAIRAWLAGTGSCP